MYRRNLNGLLYCLLIILIACAVSTRAHRCYVCGGQRAVMASDSDSGEHAGSVLPGRSPPPPCDSFDPNNLGLYARECPEEFSGCITQVNGTQITRNCEDVQVNDCQTANNIQYCFCRDDLCNGEYDPSKHLHPHQETPLRPQLTQTSDDEDISEGSGKSQDEETPFVKKSTKNFDETSSRTDQHNPTLTTTRPTNSANGINLKFVSLLLCMTTGLIRM